MTLSHISMNHFMVFLTTKYTMIINPSKQIGYIMKMYRLTDGHLIYHTPGHFSDAYSMGEEA